MHVHALAMSIMSETVIEWVGREPDRGIAALPDFGSGVDEDPEAELPADYQQHSDLFGPSRAGYSGRSRSGWSSKPRSGRMCS